MLLYNNWPQLGLALCAWRAVLKIVDTYVNFCNIFSTLRNFDLNVTNHVTNIDVVCNAETSGSDQFRRSQFHLRILRCSLGVLSVYIVLKLNQTDLFQLDLGLLKL